MNKLQEFRHFQLSEAADGNSLELSRAAGEVACLAFDTQRRYFVEMHVLAQDFGGGGGREEESFFAMAKEASTVRHQGVAAVFESGSDEGTPYFVTELVDGERLDAYIARTSPLPEPLAVSLVLQASSGLAALRQFPGLLAGADLLGARVVEEAPVAGGLAVKLCDLGLASAPQRKPPRIAAMAKLESQRCALLGRLLVAASGGVAPEAGGITLKDALASSPVGGSLRRFLNAIASGEVNTVQDFARGLSRWVDNQGGDLEGALDADLLPVRLLEPALRSASAAERLTGDGYTLDHTPLAGNVVDGWPVVDGRDGRRFRLVQLPPARFCSAGLSEIVQRVSESTRGPRPRWGRLLPVSAVWNDLGGDLFAEPEPADLVSLADVSSRRGGFGPAEARWIAGELNAAFSEATEAGLQMWGIGLRALMVAGHRPDQPLGTSGDQEHLYVRCHPTLAVLVSPSRFSVGGRPPRSGPVAPDDPAAYLAVLRGLPVRALSPEARAGLDKLFAEVAAKIPGKGSSTKFRKDLFKRYAARLKKEADEPPWIGGDPGDKLKAGGETATQEPPRGERPVGSESPSFGEVLLGQDAGEQGTPAPGLAGAVEFDPEETGEAPLPGLAEVLFAQPGDAEENWNPIAKSLAHPEVSRGTGRGATREPVTGGGWAGPVIAFLLATAATVATVAYFMGWWPFEL